MEYLIRKDLKERTGYHDSLLERLFSKEGNDQRQSKARSNAPRGREVKKKVVESKNEATTQTSVGGFSSSQILHLLQGALVLAAAAKALAMIVSTGAQPAKQPKASRPRPRPTTTDRPVQLHGSGGRKPKKQNKNITRLARSRSRSVVSDFNISRMCLFYC